MNTVMMETLTSRMEELGLGYMSAGLDSFLSEQGRQDKTVIEIIFDLVELEYIPRKERTAKTRLKVSGIPEKKLLENFDLSWLKAGLTQSKFNELSSLSFIERKENVILMGPSGLGKSHILLGLGCKACMSGYTAYYMNCNTLIETLIKMKKLNRLNRKLSWFKKPHLMLIDEVGYENLGPEEATLFFQLVNTRYEHGSIVITTNKPFSKWGEIMNDNAKATATLDRLLHHSHVISLKGDSYRMKDRLKAGLTDISFNTEV